MKGRSNVPLRVAAVSATAGLVAVMAAGPAVAAEGDVDVVNTETVSIYTDATGKVEKKRIYEQISATGDGSVDLLNPAQTEGMRNLDGFGGFDTEGDQQVVNLQVDGEKRLRTVSDYPGELPLDVSVRYYLDGLAVEPGEIVGESGELEVRYTVKNVTAAPQELTFDDGKGGTITKTVDVPIPMVGSLTTVAPPNFTDVESGQANMAGDGKGGTKLSFTMTLFPPLGSDTAEFGYKANISDGVVPRAAITALPVNPLESPSFKSAGESYQGGADTGIELAAGASEIDANLLKLRDGAGELLAGLIQLRNGAVELEAGLSGVAAPGADRLSEGASELAGGVGQLDDGAERLAAGAGELNSGAGQVADGAGELAEGTGKLDDGAQRLASGSGRLAAGTGDALSGSEQLTGGLALISGGLEKLADAKTGLPAARAGITELQDGVERLLAGLGSTDDETTLIGGLHKLELGLGELETGAWQLHGGLTQLVAPDKLPAAQAGAEQIRDGLAESTQTGGSLDQLKGALGAVKRDACDPAPDDMVSGVAPVPLPCDVVLDQLMAGVEDSRDKLLEAQGGADQIAGGLAQAIGALNSLLIPGADSLATNLSGAKSGAADLKSGAIEIKGGVQQVAEGLDQLYAGVSTAVSGVLQLSAGASDAYSGSQALESGLGQLSAGADELNLGAGQLADGTDELDAGAGRLSAGAGQLADGSGELADGAGELADGTGRAADGANQVADGANQLATGLGDAADGSGQIADGLKEAAKGAPKLENGAQRLSDEGTSKLVEAGEATAQDYGEMYATIEAGAERAQTEKMVYGAPEGAMGLAAFSYEIGGEDGEGGRNLARGLGGAVILAAGAGAFALRRRFI